jgi:predicted membrane protein
MELILKKYYETNKKIIFTRGSNQHTAVGFIISLTATFVIFPLVGFESSFSKNLIVTLFFTVISILRGYFIRRFFNKVAYKK